MPDISQEEKWLPIPQQRRHKVKFSEIDGGFCRVNCRPSFSNAKPLKGRETLVLGSSPSSPPSLAL
ncbi:hypothetical protein AMTR_s01143p00007110 [Amborella trichopoda]|uniref:Uncharacterized protein n=1 Tax=Amborella trichopoda TaxID=13333 RepID=W1NLQ7_AMBTC|nr:hypothetical protein AMTR_s01143p00007110 [Amborella trichopoda]